MEMVKVRLYGPANFDGKFQGVYRKQMSESGISAISKHLKGHKTLGKSLFFWL